MGSENTTPLERIEHLENHSEIIKIEIGYIKAHLTKTDSEFTRIYEKIDSMKNMIIVSLISTTLTLIGIIALFAKG